MNEQEKIIIDAAKKYLNGRPLNFKLIRFTSRGSKSYAADEIISSLEKDEDFRKWFVENVLRLSTELVLRGGP